MLEKIKEIERIQFVKELTVINEEIILCTAKVVQFGKCNAKLDMLKSRKHRLIEDYKRIMSWLR